MWALYGLNMPTRNIYVKLSKSLQGKESALKKILVSIWLGGFILMVLLAKIIGNPEIVVGIGGRLWFSTCVVVGVCFMAVTTFNPERDPIDKKPIESWAVVILNIALIMAVYVWFMEG